MNNISYFFLRLRVCYIGSKIEKVLQNCDLKKQNLQYQSIVMEEVISIFIEYGKEGKNQLIEWFLNNVMEEGQECSSHPCNTRSSKKQKDT